MYDIKRQKYYNSISKTSSLNEKSDTKFRYTYYDTNETKKIFK